MAKRRLPCDDSLSNPPKKTFSIFKSPLPTKIGVPQPHGSTVVITDPSAQTPPDRNPQLRTPSTAPTRAGVNVDTTPVSHQPPARAGVNVDTTPVSNQPPARAGVNVDTTHVSHQPPARAGVNVDTTPVSNQPPSRAGVNVDTTPVSHQPQTPISAASSVTKQKYKGVRVDIASVVKWAGPGVLTQYSALQGKRNRAFVKCNTCAAHEDEARRYSENGFVYMAHGVRYDSEKKVTDVIDHILSPMHKAAEETKRHKEQWAIQSTNHPWIQALKKHELSVVSSLIRLAIDVYNDSKLLTPTAWSWPSRSLASMHAEAQINLSKEYGTEYDFNAFDPSGSELHYRDPVVYAEMLSTISDVVATQLKEEIAGAVKVSAQIDGSVDLKQHDNKFVFIRFNKADDPLQVETRFAAVASSERRGSEGLLDVLLSTLNMLNLSTDVLGQKFVGVTTDGEMPTRVDTRVCGNDSRMSSSDH